MSRKPVVDRLAIAFSKEVRDSFTGAELREIVRRNKQYAIKYPECCATQEFADANMIMEAAFKATFHREPDVSSDYDSGLWNKAWDKAKRAEFQLKEDDVAKI